MKLEIFPPAHMVIEGRKLQNAAHPFQDLIGRGRKRLPEYLNRPAGRLPYVGKHLHHRGFPGSIRPQKPVNFPLLHMKPHIMNDFPFVNNLRKMIRL